MIFAAALPFGSRLNDKLLTPDPRFPTLVHRRPTDHNYGRLANI